MGIFKALFKDNNEFNVKQLKAEVNHLSLNLMGLEANLKRAERQLFELTNPFKFNIGDEVYPKIDKTNNTALADERIKFTVLTRKVFNEKERVYGGTIYYARTTNAYDLYCAEPEGKGTLRLNVSEGCIDKYEEPTTEIKP